MKEELSRLFSAFTRAEAAFELTDEETKVSRWLRRLRAKWLLRRARRLFEKHLEAKAEITSRVLNIGARIYFHSADYMRAIKYAKDILKRDIGANQRALALAILAECHEMIGNSEKPEDTFKLIFAELDHKLEPINQIRILRSRAGFEGRRGNIKKAERYIKRARNIAGERGFVDELHKLDALEMMLLRKR
ncbi:hypothetical protein A3I27_03585 [Candidatus Giovannonibacteria bacterium RIFCSPLOWO2_02_FULL_43_11b]|nr:MAG: hypothetical protein A3I27_03585 [Candidatus Giovannonibacteria bacterium RIFCSPLOWO2_02_FULL_43_11b]OGF92115.1 MAG: hypothetical protein A3H04_01525 [Candidatus Giovannonibacteria bacterium RIFCSPLOWO2_12_FULL_43_11c]